MIRPAIDSISPFFIVNRVHQSISFYQDKLGFGVTFQEPPPPHQDPFFAVLSRDGAMIFLKGSGDPLPNAQRYSWLSGTRISMSRIPMRSPASSPAAAPLSASRSRIRTMDCAALR
jgi:hypothetical protein